MYLIFLILSIIQIPADWISVNGYVNKYIERPEADYSDPILEQAANAIDSFEVQFLESVLYDKETKHIKEPNSYTKSDIFLIDENNGKTLFDIIVKLNGWIATLDSSDKRRISFEKLFKYDLENGIASGNEKAWIKWRWKNVPAIVVNNFIKELKLRILLLNKSEFKEIEKPKPLISFNSTVSKIYVNEEVFLSLKGDTFKSIKVLNNNQESFDYKLLRFDSLVFKPTVSGKYLIKINNTEELPFEVFPKFLSSKESIPLRLCYSGIDYRFKIESKIKNAKINVEGDEHAIYNSENGEIKFNIEKEGWCGIKLKTNNGLVFHDSVFIKSIPNPRITITELPSFSISKQRLTTIKQLNLFASHPSISSNFYKLESFKVKWVNSNPRQETINGSKFQFNNSDIESLKYIIIHDINIKVGNKIKSLDQSIIIPIQ